jgi:hypothetical protein
MKKDALLRIGWIGSSLWVFDPIVRRKPCDHQNSSKQKGGQMVRLRAIIFLLVAISSVPGFSSLAASGEGKVRIEQIDKVKVEEMAFLVSGETNYLPLGATGYIGIFNHRGERYDYTVRGESVQVADNGMGYLVVRGVVEGKSQVSVRLMDWHLDQKQLYAGKPDHPGKPVEGLKTGRPPVVYAIEVVK